MRSETLRIFLRTAVCCACLAAWIDALAAEVSTGRPDVAGDPGAAVRPSGALVAAAQPQDDDADDEADEPNPADSPASKEDLFGLDKPAPESKESLFGTDKPAPAATVGPIRLSGFVNAVAGYTYADPEHWSRGVVRLQLAAQGALPAGVRWKLSGRVDVDPVYYQSNFYPDAVKHDQRLEFFYRENYLDFSANDWDFRVGAQQIVWGEVIGLYFADVVSARDMREFLLPGFDVMRIPQWAARAEYTRGNGHLELIWIPVPAFDKIGKPGSEFYPVPLPSPLPNDLGVVFRDPVDPSRSVHNSNFGVRANTLVAGWDLAAFYYRSFSTQPTFYRLAQASPADPIVFEPRHDRIWQVGATMSKDLGEVVLRGEAVYTSGQNYAVADLTTPVSAVERGTFDAIGSAEWTFARETRLNVQIFGRHYFDGGGAGLAIPNDGLGGSIYLSSKPFGANWEPQLLWIRNFKDGGSLVRPRVNWTAARNTTLTFGVDIFTGDADTFFGRYNNRDRVYGELRYDF